MTGSGLFLAPSAVVGPVPEVLGWVLDGQGDFGEQAADFVAGQRDQLTAVCAGTPFTDSMHRVTTRNAAAAIARVMCAYQAS